MNLRQTYETIAVHQAGRLYRSDFFLKKNFANKKATQIYDPRGDSMCFLYIDLNDPLKVLSLEQHRECPGDDQCEADGGLPRELLVKYDVGERDRDEDAQLVDRDDETRRSFVHRLIVAEPGTTGRKARQNDEEKLVFRNLFNLLHLTGNRYHDPRHHEHNTGPDRSAEI